MLKAHILYKIVLARQYLPSNMMNFDRRKLCLAFLFNLLVPCCLIYLYGLFPNKLSSPSIQRQEIIVAHHGAVATDDQRCSEIGLKVLLGTRPLYSHPGNAVDAAVAAALCLGVVSLASSGIGGGAFMVLRLANGTTQAFDMRETAPMEASEDMYGGNTTLKCKGPLSIAVPGELAGLYEVWEKYGTLPWESLVTPSVDLAWGFKISDYLYWEMTKVESDILADKGLSDILTLNGKLLRNGDICQNIKLAETLKRIAKDGVKAFYNGPIGIDLTRDVLELGGILRMKDLQSYTVKMREPIVADISGLEFIGMPPPSAGGAGIILMLNILAQYGVPLNVSGRPWIHREVEALKHVFAVRLNIGDPDFVDVTKVISDMLSVEFAKELKQTINDSTTNNSTCYGGRWNELHEYQMHEHGTSHLSVVDHQGNAVALTTSVNYHFGSQILSPRTGILLNNQMDDFSIRNTSANKQSSANFIRPGKRPLSSMSPTIILKNGKLKAVAGASGGTLIIPGVSELVLNYFAKGKDELSSVIAPRVYPQLIPNELKYENFTTVTGAHIEVSATILTALKKKGHVLRTLDSGSVCQFITLKELLKGTGNAEQEIVAVSDPRKGGVPAGY